jgi:hypothetical protein
MADTYLGNRERRWSDWERHYQQIHFRIYNLLKDKVYLNKSFDIDLIGVDHFDLIDGSLRLDYKPINTPGAPTLGELLKQAKSITVSDIVFTEIVLVKKELDKYFADELEVETNASPSVEAKHLDITEGFSRKFRLHAEKITADTIERIFNNKEKPIDPDKVMSMFKRCVYQMTSGSSRLTSFLVPETEAPKQTGGVGRKTVGISAMVQTATLVPMTEYIHGVVSELRATKKLTVEKERVITEILYSVVEQFNNWLMSDHVSEWFRGHPDGELLIITDVEKQFYETDKSGNIDESRIDEGRKYKVLTHENFEALVNNGSPKYSIEEVGEHIWADEDTHRHIVKMYKIARNMA